MLFWKSFKIYLLTWFILLLPHFPHKDLGVFYSRKSQLCSLEILNIPYFSNLSPWKTAWTLPIYKQISIFLFFCFFSDSYLQVVGLSHGPFSLLFHFLCPFKFWQILLIDLQCNIKLQNQNAVNEVAGKIVYFFCISGCTCSSCSFISPY